jgi:hypothetical protein
MTRDAEVQKIPVASLIRTIVVPVAEGSNPSSHPTK